MAIKNPGNAKRLGVDLATVVADCHWFGLLRDVRDSIVHRGGRVLVFPEHGRILSQENEGFRNKVHIMESCITKTWSTSSYMQRY